MEKRIRTVVVDSWEVIGRVSMKYRIILIDNLWYELQVHEGKWKKELGIFYSKILIERLLSLKKD